MVPQIGHPFLHQFLKDLLVDEHSYKIGVVVYGQYLLNHCGQSPKSLFLAQKDKESCGEKIHALAVANCGIPRDESAQNVPHHCDLIVLALLRSEP
jgi:hypothetical protein